MLIKTINYLPRLGSLSLVPFKVVIFFWIFMWVGAFGLAIDSLSADFLDLAIGTNLEDPANRGAFFFAMLIFPFIFSYPILFIFDFYYAYKSKGTNLFEKYKYRTLLLTLSFIIISLILEFLINGFRYSALIFLLSSLRLFSLLSFYFGFFIAIHVIIDLVQFFKSYNSIFQKELLFDYLYVIIASIFFLSSEMIFNSTLIINIIIITSPIFFILNIIYFRIIKNKF